MYRTKVMCYCVNRINIPAKIFTTSTWNEEGHLKAKRTLVHGQYRLYNGRENFSTNKVRQIEEFEKEVATLALKCFFRGYCQSGTTIV